MNGWTADFQGKRRRILALTIGRTDQESGWFKSRAVPFDRIDVTLKYYLPSRGKAVCTFIGPFEVGKAVQCQEGIVSTLTPTGAMWSDGRGTKFHISATNIPAAMEVYDRVLAYDVQGKQYLVPSGGSSTGFDNRSSAERDYLIEDLPLSRIAAITVGEEPQAKTFRNILVRYPDRPARDYPEYLDKMAATLGLAGLSPDQLQKYEFKSVQEAMKVIDIVRGQHLDAAWQMIERADIAALDQDLQDKLHRTAKTWADNGDGHGIQLGLKGKWPEFVAPALAALDKDPRYRSEIARSLQSYRHFTPQELGQIATVLEQHDDPRTLYSLLDCLYSNKRQPGGREALLRLARTDKVWLWWPALGYLTDSEGLTLGQLPRDLQVKCLARSNPELGLDPVLAGEARALLATLPTAKLAVMNTDTLRMVMLTVADNLPRAEAQTTFLNLLQDMVNHWGEYQFEGYSPSTWWPIDRAVRYLNNWNNLNLGGVGSDVTEYTHDGNTLDWQAMAKETLEHFERTPTSAPATRPVASAPVKTETRSATLVDALGQPIPEAMLDLQAAGPYRSRLRPMPYQEGPKLHVQTDSKGQFQIDWPIRTGERQVVSFIGQASHPDYGAASVIVHAGNGVAKAFLVKKGSPQYERALKGQVVNEAGQPIPGAMVESRYALARHGNADGIPIGDGTVITDSDGRFVMHVTPDSEGDKSRVLPPGATYIVVARAPAGMDLFPVQVEGQSPVRLVLRTPTLRPRPVRFELGKDEYAQGEQLDGIPMTYTSPDTQADGIVLEERYVSGEPVRLVPGLYSASFRDARGRWFEYLPVDIDQSSPEVITFRRPPAVTYHGQVVDGATGKPMAGALVCIYAATTGNTNLAMLFEQDWLNLHAMPDQPSLDDPGVKALRRYYAVQAIARTDANGHYEVTRGQEQAPSASITALAKDRLPITMPLSALKVDGQQRAEVSAIPLFPAAYVTLRPQVPVGARFAVSAKWEYQPGEQPEWLPRCRKVMEEAGFPGRLDMSGPVRLFVPAGVRLKLRLQEHSGSSLAPTANEEVLNLSPGETKDLGALVFVPRQSTSAASQNAPAGKKGPADDVTSRALPETQPATQPGR